MNSGRIYILITLITTFWSCQSPDGPPPSSFVTTLGNDTLVIEQFSFSSTEINAEVLIRSPRTIYYKQKLKLDSEGGFQSFSSKGYDALNLGGEPMIQQKVTIEGDSIMSVTQRGEDSREIKVLFDPSLIPWMDMVHWPYEVATRRMVSAGLSEVDQLMFTGRNAAIFEIRSTGEQAVSIKHPYRGTMTADLTTEGGLQSYDATQTTRKLIVKRGPTLDMETFIRSFDDRPVGSLSGEGKTEQNVLGADITITFGQPARRGRDLFGGIVRWNERWRTGANRATHLKTSQDLVFGELTVPAGEYTLFTIPQPEGGTLIINKQTGQNGNTYDEAQDLGRIPMTLVTQEESEELFTIVAIERDNMGVLQLKWGATIFEIPFEVIVSVDTYM